MTDGDERREHPRAFVGLLVRVGYGDVDEFVERYASNISEGGLFIQSREPFPAETLVRFEVKLRTGETVLEGKGVVVWSRTPDQTPSPGMGIRFLELGEDARRLVRRMVQLRNSQASAAQQPPAPQALPAPPVPGVQPVPPIRPVPPPIRPVPPPIRPVPPPIREVPATPAPRLPPGMVPPSPRVPMRQAADLAGLDVEVEAPREEAKPTIEVDASLGAVTFDKKPAGGVEVDIALDGFDGGAGQGKPAPTAAHQAGPARGGASSRVIGIDLGTSTSCAAIVLVDGRPQVIPSRKGYRTIPSIVAYDSKAQLLVGHPAKAQLELNPTNTVYGSKRLVGRPFDSPAVRELRDRFHYKIVEGPQHEAAVQIQGRTFSLQQISAFILSEMRDICRELLGEEVSRAVITVPAYYNENQRQAVREAGMLAGLSVERIVNEPTAAALAFGFNRGLDQRVMVYDLGGGTFDVSILELTDNVYQVVATGGDTFLGGVDFDNQLVDHLLQAFCEQVGGVPKLDRSAMQRLRDAAEAAKCALSEKTETYVRLPFFAAVKNTPKDLELKVTRGQLEELVGTLVERTVLVSQEVLRRAGLAPTDLDSILLVGGQSRMPLVWRRIRETFAKEPTVEVDPEEAVALGAALLADSLDRIDSVVLIDVLPMSIGLGLPGGGFLVMLQGGTGLPATRTYTMSTFREGQTRLELFIFQGESQRVLQNEYLGTVVIQGIPPAPKGAVQLELTFSLDQECVLKVTTQDRTHGRPLETRMEAGASEVEIRQRLRIPDSEVHAPASSILGTRLPTDSAEGARVPSDTSGGARVPGDASGGAPAQNGVGPGPGGPAGEPEAQPGLSGKPAE
ncbi:MAG TPA: TIGR02266 family protein [Myxococcota bacterium]|nr:TIGR02266 family protein [Myxococcota bacterium]HRY95734.1 TIGR02266 family protein [Myxococcota bacterium]